MLCFRFRHRNRLDRVRKTSWFALIIPVLKTTITDRDGPVLVARKTAANIYGFPLITTGL